MITLTAGSSWIAFQGTRANPATPGTKYEVLFVSFDTDVPPANPAMPAQDILTVDVDGQIKKHGCGVVLSKVFRTNKMIPGAGLVITYLGQKPSKKPGMAPYHDYHVGAMETPTNATYDVVAPPAPVPSVQPAAVVDTELADRLAAARKRRAS